MAESNQRVGGPYGDIYIVNTPKLDQMGDRLYKEHLADQQRQRQAVKASDDEFSKNLTAIRDADVDDLTKKYGDYKLANIELIKKGDKATPQERLAVLAKKGDVYKHIATSKKEKEQEEFYQKEAAKNPNIYDENALTLLTERRKMPVSAGFKFKLPNSATKNAGFTEVDFGDIPSAIQYKAGTTDFTKDIKTASGTKSLRGEPIIKDIDNGLSREVIQYKAGNSPSEYINALQGSVVGSKKTRHLPLEYNFSDDEANKIMMDYAKLKETPAFKSAYPNEPEIPASFMQSPTGRTMALMAMEAQLLDPPTEIRKTERNISAIRKADDERDAFRNKRGFKQSMAKIAANKKAGVPNEDVGYISDEVFSAAGEDASIPPVLAKRIGLNPTKSYKVVYADKVDPQRLNIITAADKDGIGGVAGINIPQEDGSTRSMYIVDESTGDWIGENGQVISREGAKDRYIKEVSPSKFKMQAGTKASEKRKFISQGEPNKKPAKKISGW